LKKGLIGLLILLFAATAWGQSPPAQSPKTYAKNKQWKNVKDFGAKGDGTTNDRAAIQAAISALPDTGGTVFVPRGIFLVDSAIAVPSHVTLLGLGMASEIRMDATFPHGEQDVIVNEHQDTTEGSWTWFWGGVTAQYPPYPSYADSAAAAAAEGEVCNYYLIPQDSNITIQGLYLNGGRSDISMDDVIADSPATYGMSILFAHNVLIQDCYISNTHNDGIALRYCTDSRILDNVLWDIGEDGIILSGWGARRNIVRGNILKMRDSTFKCTITGPWLGTVGSGLVVKCPEVTFVDNIVMFGGQGGELHDEDNTPLRDITYKNNMFLGCLSGGIAVRDGSNINIEGNTFRDIGSRGVYVYEDADQVTITNNFFYGGLHHSIHVGAGAHHKITNNTVQSNYNTAIKVETCPGTMILGNIVTDVDSGEGIRVQTSKHSTVSNNTVRRADSTGIILTGYSSADEFMVVSDNVCDSNGRDGIALLNVDVSTISGNLCTDNDSGTTGSYSGIYLYYASRNVLSNNIATSPGGTQTYGINLSSSTKNVITSNQLGGNVTGGLNGYSVRQSARH